METVTPADNDVATSVSENLARLRSLPPLRYRASRTARCTMCGADADPFCSLDFNAICNAHDIYEPAGVLVPYFRCRRCEFLFTDFCNSWTSRDFADLIYNDEYMLVDGEYDGTRSRRDAIFMGGFLSEAKQMRLLDYGSGMGHFESAMREQGFASIESYDPFSHPERPTGQFDIVTSFETIEHSPDPACTLRDMLAFMKDDGCLLIGQTLQPRDIEEQGSGWWYLAPRNGHISTFSHETIRAFADREGVIFDSFGGLFALSRPQRSTYLANLLAPRAVPNERLLLFSPPPGMEVAGWHGPESDGTWFRWTGESEISLGEIVLDREGELIVPFINLADPSFLEASQLRIGEHVLPLKARRRELLVSVPAMAGVHAVMLMTPAHYIPPNDLRLLGLAIPCAPQPSTLNPLRANRWS